MELDWRRRSPKAVTDVSGQRGGEVATCAASSRTHSRGTWTIHHSIYSYRLCTDATTFSISVSLPPTILTMTEPHRRVVFSMALEGI